MRAGRTVSLGPLVAADAQAMFNWMNDPAIAESNGVWRPTDGMDFTSWFQTIGKDATRVTFAIRTTAEPRLVGYLSIMSIHAVFRSAELGVTIGAEADRGKGLGREAMELAMAYCWDSLNLERLSLRIYGDNPRAVRCYQSAGFRLEGVQRKAAWLNGRRLDVTLMGALRHE